MIEKQVKDLDVLNKLTLSLDSKRYIVIAFSKKDYDEIKKLVSLGAINRPEQIILIKEVEGLHKINYVEITTMIKTPHTYLLFFDASKRPSQQYINVINQINIEGDGILVTPKYYLFVNYTISQNQYRLLKNYFNEVYTSDSFDENIQQNKGF